MGKKLIQIWISCLWLVSRPPKSGCLFGKFNEEQILTSFLGRSNSLEPPVFRFSNRRIVKVESLD